MPCSTIATSRKQEPLLDSNFSSSGNNYTLTVPLEQFTAHYYFTYTKQETTAIRKKGPRTSILPKNRSFDLLGRTVNKKRRL